MNQLAKVRIYFKSRNRREIKMEPEFPNIYSYIVVIGGSLSVYMGFSFVSILEIMELIYDWFSETEPSKWRWMTKRRNGNDIAAK